MWWVFRANCFAALWNCVNEFVLFICVLFLHSGIYQHIFPVVDAENIFCHSWSKQPLMPLYVIEFLLPCFCSWYEIQSRTWWLLRILILFSFLLQYLLLITPIHRIQHINFFDILDHIFVNFKYSEYLMPKIIIFLLIILRNFPKQKLKPIRTAQMWRTIPFNKMCKSNSIDKQTLLSVDIVLW